MGIVDSADRGLRRLRTNLKEIVITEPPGGHIEQHVSFLSRLQFSFKGHVSVCLVQQSVCVVSVVALKRSRAFILFCVSVFTYRLFIPSFSHFLTYEIIACLADFLPWNAFYRNQFQMMTCPATHPPIRKHASTHTHTHLRGSRLFNRRLTIKQKSPPDFSTLQK